MGVIVFLGNLKYGLSICLAYIMAFFILFKRQEILTNPIVAKKWEDVYEKVLEQSKKTLPPEPEPEKEPDVKICPTCGCNLLLTKSTD
jgi:sulfur transfer protein SufE